MSYNKSVKRNSKGFAPILILVILGVIGVVAYLMFKLTPPPDQRSFGPEATQTPDSFATLSGDEVLRDWKTYVNTKYGYGIKYPPKAEVIDLWSDGDPQESYMLKVSLNDDGLAIITYVLKEKDETLKELVERYLYNYDSQSPNCMTKDLTITNHSALSITCESKTKERTYIQYFVYIQKDDYHAVSLRPEDISPGEDEYIKEYFDQILSTFKFTQ